MSCPSPPEEALTPRRQRRAARLRKQKLVSKLSDSGFEEDLLSAAISRRFRINESNGGGDEQEPGAGQLPNWYLQYGDVGFQIQREKEAQFQSCKSLARQPQLTAAARCKLVSWLIPVHKHFRLSFECCCLTVNIMDRFLASTPVASDCFQLLGVTALLLASKQVEVCSPPVSHLLSLCCDAFTKEQLRNLEGLVLLRLNFRLAAPTLAFFLDYFANCIEASRPAVENRSGGMFSGVSPGVACVRRCSSLAQKVCELTLADYAFNKYPPSLTASSALTLAWEFLKSQQGSIEQSGGDQWGDFTEELSTQTVSGQTPEDPGSDDDSVAVNQNLLPVGEVLYNRSLVQECKENLRLLVSLNQETMSVV